MSLQPVFNLRKGFCIAAGVEKDTTKRGKASKTSCWKAYKAGTNRLFSETKKVSLV